MTTSESTASKDSAAHKATASGPSGAVRTSYPAFSNAIASRDRIAASSSTIRMRGMFLTLWGGQSISIVSHYLPYFRWPFRASAGFLTLSPGARRCRLPGLHRGDAGLHRARQMRCDAQHPFHHHELSAMMHLVFLHAENQLEAGLAGGRRAGRHAHALAQEIVGKTFQPFGKTLTAIA